MSAGAAHVTKRTFSHSMTFCFSPSPVSRDELVIPGPMQICLSFDSIWSTLVMTSHSNHPQFLRVLHMQILSTGLKRRSRWDQVPPGGLDYISCQWMNFKRKKKNRENVVSQKEIVGTRHKGVGHGQRLEKMRTASDWIICSAVRLVTLHHALLFSACLASQSFSSSPAGGSSYLQLHQLHGRILRRPARIPPPFRFSWLITINSQIGIARMPEIDCGIRWRSAIR